MAKSSGSNSSNRVNGASSALLIIDLVTDFEFEDGDELLKRTMPAARKLSEFKSRAKRAGLPVIYVNDNFD